MSGEFANLLKLSRAERLQLVEDLWDSIVEEADAPPVSDPLRDELRRRKERFLKRPGSGLSWEEVKRQARSSND